MSRSRARLVASVAQAALLAFAAGAVHAAEASSDAANASSDSTITVTANGKKSAVARVVATGVLGERSALDTPFSVVAVTSDEIRNLQVKDINGVFRNDASITEVNSSVAQASGASFRVRGLAMDTLNGYKIDGLAIPYWSIDLPVEQFDQIQLLKGATGFMYGFGGPAGIVNFISKRPTDQTTLGVDVGYRSDSLFSGHIDAGGRVGGGRFGYRQYRGVTDRLECRTAIVGPSVGERCERERFWEFSGCVCRGASCQCANRQSTASGSVERPDRRSSTKHRTGRAERRGAISGGSRTSPRLFCRPVRRLCYAALPSHCKPRPNAL